MKTLACCLLFALIAGCSSPPADLAYSPTAPITPQNSAPLVAVVRVTDARDEKDPTYVGAIRGGFGNPLKTLTTTRPVGEEVRAAFEAALQARGLLGPRAPMQLDVTLTELSANQYHRREGHTALSLALVDRATGRPVIQDKEDVLKINGSVVTFDAGVFASLDDLRAVAALSLSTAIDQALAKPPLHRVSVAAVS